MSKFLKASALFLLTLGSALAGPASTPVLRCPPDWKVELVAQTPAIVYPSVVCCAPDGRIFLGQDPMDMGNPSDKPSDKILCIFPDGKITVFATNLYAVYGLQYLDGKVYVHHTPKFSVFDDDHGVGTNRIDLIQNDNLHPWLPSFNDHIPSNFRLAMDGYFYVSTGDKGIFGAVGTDGRKLEMHGGGIYRMRPNGTELEVYCTGTRNHLDIAINPEDEMFTYDNTDDGGGWWTRVSHMVDGGFYGYPYNYRPQRPYTLWMMTDYQGGAPTGVVAYDEDALPAEYHGNLFMCDWGRAQVLRLKVKRVGATYEVVSRVQDQKLDFLTKGAVDDFRPVGITETPDGTGFYVTDWGKGTWKHYDVIGRLFKVTYTGASLAAPKPAWYVPAATGQKFHASTRELVAALSHPSEAVRLVAQRRLADRKKDGEKKLAALVKDAKAEPYARWSAIWTLDAIDGGAKERKVILAAARDKDVTVEMQAVRELGTRRVKEAVRPLIALLQSTNAAVRLRAATALGRIGDASAIDPLLQALDEKDLFARYADFKALNRIGVADSAVWPRIVEGLASEDPRIREGTDFAVRETYDLGLANALGAFEARPNVPLETRTNVLQLLSEMYHERPAWQGDWWSTTPVNGAPAAKTVTWEGSPLIADVMRQSLKDSQTPVREIAFKWVRAAHDTNVAGLLRDMFDKETNVVVKADLLRSMAEANDPITRQFIGSILHDAKSPVPLLDAALEDVQKMSNNQWNDDLIRLAQHPANDGILIRLLQIFGKNKLTQTADLLGKNLDNTNPQVRKAANQALIQIGNDASIAIFRARLDNASLDFRRQAIEALGTMRAKSAVRQLMGLASDDRVGTYAVQALTQIQDLAAEDIYLDGLGSKNSSMRFQCRMVIAGLRDTALPRIQERLATNGLSDDAIETLKEIYQSSAAAKKTILFKTHDHHIPVSQYETFALSNPGEAARGRVLFHDLSGAACIRCHRLNNEGAPIGPDLTGVGAKYSRAQLIDSVLHPSNQILDGYQQVMFTTKEGDDLGGIVRSENQDDVTLVDSAGVTHVIPKATIATRTISKISLMPEGLQTGLSLKEFSDLIAYLQNPNARPAQRSLPVLSRPPQPRQPFPTLPKVETTTDTGASEFLPMPPTPPVPDGDDERDN